MAKISGKKKIKSSRKPLDKKKYFIISVDTFSVDIAFFINYTTTEMLDECVKVSADLHRYLKEYIDNEEPDTEAIKARTYPLTKGFVVRLNFPSKSFRQNVALLSHEVSHLVSWILLDRRVPLSKDSDEVYAYLTEEIMEKFLFKWY